MEDEFDVTLNFKGKNDVAFFAVYDGHGGGEASKYASRNLSKEIADQEDFEKNTKDAVKSAFQKVDAEFLAKVELAQEKKDIFIRAGTTVASVLIKRDKIYCCNLGDSSAVMCRGGHASRIAKEHRATQQKEIKRILNAGTEIHHHRLGGRLAVPRGIGDAQFKDLPHHAAAASTAKPSVKAFSLDQTVSFIIIACDGLWDVCTPKEAVNFVKHGIHEGLSLDGICKGLVKTALGEGSSDNVTVIIVKFDHKIPRENNKGGK